MSFANRCSLQGKRVLVTGASAGIGHHFAQVLAREGAQVALGARRVDALAELENRLRSAGSRAMSVRLDVTSESSVQEALASIVHELGGLDVLVNNAGVVVQKPLSEQSEADWDRVLDTNLKGPFLVGRQFARHLRLAKCAGSIVNVASILGLRQGKQVTPYAVSKAGLIQLTRQMALEWAPDQIRVNAIAPGYVETDLNREHYASDAGRAMLKRIPQRRTARMEELDGALLLLASDVSPYMTGSVIVVDGGHTLSSL